MGARGWVSAGDADRLEGFNTKDTKDTKARFARWTSSRVVGLAGRAAPLRGLLFLRGLRVSLQRRRRRGSRIQNVNSAFGSKPAMNGAWQSNTSRRPMSRGERR
jgi:hypothetical protein